MLRLYACLAGFVLFINSFVLAADWPAFRGPSGTGISAEKNLPATWGPDKNILWKFELPGPSNSSPIVSAGRVFVTCAEEKGTQRNLYCIDRKSGKLVWMRSVEYSEPEQMHKTNPYCGSTPAADGKRVVVWRGSAGLYCYDFAGNELWKRDLGKFTHQWGYGSSPVLHQGRVFVSYGAGVESFMVAVSLESGDILWKQDDKGGNDSSDPPRVGSWSTPIITKVDGQDQLLCSMPARVNAYDPKTGKIIWTLGGLEGPNGKLMYTSPVISEGVAVAMAGYTGPAVGFELGGTGDVTKSNTLWSSKEKQPQRIGSGVIVDGFLYMANADGGTAQCHDIGTGEVRWRTRLAGGGHWGSTVFADGKLYATNQSGTTYVFRPNPEKFDQIAVNRMDEPTNATPAISNGQIFLKTDKSLYCIGE
jgi:outer membrane protein assembly factor BamB